MSRARGACLPPLPALPPPPPRAAPAPAAATRHRYYDFLSESDTGPGTPDFRSEESDSSTGSILDRVNAEASRVLWDEWERIERTIYGEDGEHVTRPLLLQECKQWRELFPQLRIVGRQIPIPERRSYYRDIHEEEVIAMHYSDYEQFSESEERLSESSFSDSTPKNSPRSSMDMPIYEPRLNQQKSAFTRNYYSETGLPDSFYSMLQITPLYPRSPSLTMGKRHYSSIIKSDISSSKWMRNSTPDTSQSRIKNDRNSAKSFISLDTTKYNSIASSANDRKKVNNGSRVFTAKYRDNTRLEPLFTHQTVLGDGRKHISTNNFFSNGKVSLPPLQIDEDKSSKCINSARRSVRKSKKSAPRNISFISENKSFIIPNN